MSYLLDTNVISDLVRPKPSAGVLRWFRTVPDAALHLRDCETISDTGA